MAAYDWEVADDRGKADDLVLADDGTARLMMHSGFSDDDTA